jgi:hypothetical protein
MSSPLIRSRSASEAATIYGLDNNGLPIMIDMIPAESIPQTSEGMDLLLQYEMARNSTPQAFISQGKTLIGDNVA